MGIDSRYQSKQTVIEESIKIPPLNETELIKQRNKIVDDYINDMEHRKNDSKEKNKKEEGEEDDEDDIFLIAERKQWQHKEKAKSQRENRLKYPPCNNIDHSGIREQCLTSDKVYGHNTTIDNNNDRWNYANFNNNDALHLYNKETDAKNRIKKLLNNSNNKKRNKTAKNSNKLNLFENNSSVFNYPKVNHRIKSFRPDKSLESKKKKTVYEGNDAKNPYSVNWANKMLDKRYNMELELCLNGFVNGVPGIKLSTKKDQFTQV